MIHLLQVTVVAQVVNISSQTTNTMYYLDDGTGRLEARVWSSDGEDNDQEDNGIKYVLAVLLMSLYVELIDTHSETRCTCG